MDPSVLEERFIKTFEIFTMERGLGPYFGQLIALFILADNPLTQNDLASKLDVSQSTISRNLAILTKEPSFIIKSRDPITKELNYKLNFKKESPIDFLITFLQHSRQDFLSLKYSMSSLHQDSGIVNDNSVDSTSFTNLATVINQIIAACTTMDLELNQFIRNLKLKAKNN